jgi:hypothetical protein
MKLITETFQSIVLLSHRQSILSKTFKSECFTIIECDYKSRKIVYLVSTTAEALF